MGQHQAAQQGQHQAHGADAQHGLAGAVGGQAQVEPALEQHQAHQQAGDRAQTIAQVERLHQAQARPADQQTGAEQQHHPRQPREPGQGLGQRPRKHGDAPEQPQPLRRHSSSRALNRGSTRIAITELGRTTRYSPSSSEIGTFT